MNKSDIQDMRRMLNAGMSVKMVAEAFEVHRSSVYAVINGNTHNPKKKAIAKEIQREAVSGSNNHWAKLTERQVRQIRKYLSTNCYTCASLAEHYGVSSQLISLIKVGRIWKSV